MARRASPGRLVRAALSPGVIAPLAVLVVVLVLWQAGVLHQLLGLKLFVVPLPSAIVAAIAANTDGLIEATGATLSAALMGYALGMSLGFLIASALIRFAPGLAATVVPTLSATNSMPIVAVAPLIALFTGPGLGLKVIVVTIMTVPVMTIYAMRGLRDVDPMAIELLDSIEATPGQIYLMVRVRTALPYVFTALKTSIVLALIGTIVAESVQGVEGLGFIIINSTRRFQAADSWMALVVIAAIGVGSYVLIELLERVVVHWQGANRRTG